MNNEGKLSWDNINYLFLIPNAIYYVKVYLRGEVGQHRHRRQFGNNIFCYSRKIYSSWSNFINPEIGYFICRDYTQHYLKPTMLPVNFLAEDKGYSLSLELVILLILF